MFQVSPDENKARYQLGKGKGKRILNIHSLDSRVLEFCDSNSLMQGETIFADDLWNYVLLLISHSTYRLYSYIREGHILLWNMRITRLSQLCESF